MKRLTMFGFIALGAIAMLSFQNCSKAEYASSAELDSAVNEINAGKPGSENEFIRICPMVMCAAPPLGCRYENDEVSTNNSNSKSFCSSSCGRLVCDRQPPIDDLPPIDDNSDGTEINPVGEKPRVCDIAVRCQAPAEGCHMEGVEFNRQGCQVGCGHQVCPRLPPVAEPPVEPVFPIQADAPVACPMIACAQEEGCRYAGQPTLDSNGCAADCGQRVCDTRITRKPKQCPAIAFRCLDAMRGPNCVLDHSNTTDENGCVVACPIVACPVEM